MAFIAVELSDMMNLEVKIRANVLHIAIEHQNLSMLKNNTHKIFITSTTFDNLQNLRFICCLFLFILKFQPRFENLCRLYIIEFFLLIFS